MKIAAALLALILIAGCDKEPQPRGENTSRKSCEDSGGTVYSHAQWGGKWSTYTYWCVNSDKQITGIWF